MTNNTTVLISLAISILSTVSFGQINKPATDYLGVAGPIAFDKQSFSLSWSAHPAANFYKQEYIVKGDLPDKYTSMVLLDVITGETNIKNVVAAKIAELKKIKETNPVVNYDSFDNPKTGEYMIDFLLTANTPDGRNISVVERNVYRYKAFTDKSGKPGVLLFGLSSRAYGADIESFFTSIKTNKRALIDKVAQFKIPAITMAGK